MTDNKHGDGPAGNPDTQPSPQRPVPMPPQQGEMGEASNGDSAAQQGVASELSREFKWVEIAQISSSQTRFAYHLIGPAGFTPGGQPVNLSNGTVPMMSFEVGVDVPKDKIKLWQEAFASNDAR